MDVVLAWKGVNDRPAPRQKCARTSHIDAGEGSPSRSSLLAGRDAPGRLDAIVKRSHVAREQSCVAAQVELAVNAGELGEKSGMREKARVFDDGDVRGRPEVRKAAQAQESRVLRDDEIPTSVSPSRPLVQKMPFPVKTRRSSLRSDSSP